MAEPTKRKMGRPRSETTQLPTSQKILQVATRLFLEMGYEGVSIDEVAQQAGITKAMVYYYFSSKAGLFVASMMRLMENVRNRTASILNGTGSLYERLHTVAVARLSIAQRPHQLDSVMRNVETYLSDEQLNDIRCAEQLLHDTVAEAFRQGCAKGDLCDGDPELMARLYIATLIAAEQRRQHLHELGHPWPEAQTLADEVMRIFWYGVSRR